MFSEMATYILKWAFDDLMHSEVLNTHSPL